jgi:hypothetical protein
MRITTLYEGHYRALERDFADLIRELSLQGRPLWVVASGSHLLDRLRLLLAEEGKGVLAGIRFLPGIAHLALDLGAMPAVSERVSTADRALMSLDAMSVLGGDEPLHNLKTNSNTARALGDFFEELSDHGIDPETYEISSLSLVREQTPTESTIGKLFRRYWNDRKGLYSACNDMVMRGGLSVPADSAFLFYGFYDLNPLQRTFVKRLLKFNPAAYWFNPVPQNSHWSTVGGRTAIMLSKEGAGRVIRSDREIVLNGFAQIFDRIDPAARHSVSSIPDGMRISAVTGEMGACRAVLSRIGELHDAGGIPLDRIAVVRRRDRGESLVRMAHHEGVPVNAPLETNLSSLPLPSFCIDLLRFVNSGWYRVHLTALLSWGLLDRDHTAEPFSVEEVCSEFGIRMGRERWLRWAAGHPEENLSRLLLVLEDFFGSLPASASAKLYLEALGTLVSELTGVSADDPVLTALFYSNNFRSEAELTMDAFSEVFTLHCQTGRAILREADADGFRVTNFEQVRGCLYSSVLLMDMEEGVFPRLQVEDPRLSEELRSRLQLSEKSQRELEDAFLLRQAAEAAVETLDVIYREQDSSGSEVSPSPFITHLVMPLKGESPDPVLFRRVSSSPVQQLLGGKHMGQRRAKGALNGMLPRDGIFLRSLSAEESRLDFRAFDEFDGILNGEAFSFEEVSPTMLQQYLSCPFAFLAERLWGLERPVMRDVGSADPMLKGILVHDAVEEIIERYGFDASRDRIADVLRETACGMSFSESLGSGFMMEIFVESQSDSIRSSLLNLKAREWSYSDSELDLAGELGDLRIRGRVDLLLQDPEGALVLLDLKTGYVPRRKDVVSGLAFQLPFYFSLAQQNFPERPISTVGYASISSRTPGGLLEFSPSEMREIAALSAENAGILVGMMREGLFPPAPTGGCRNCGIKDLCRLTPSARIRGKVRSDDRIDFFRRMVKVK